MCKKENINKFKIWECAKKENKKIQTFEIYRYAKGKRKYKHLKYVNVQKIYKHVKYADVKQVYSLCYSARDCCCLERRCRENLICKQD